MVRAVAEEALALASVTLFLAMVAVWVQVLVLVLVVILALHSETMPAATEGFAPQRCREQRPRQTSCAQR